MGHLKNNTMKEFTVKIPDSQLHFFTELMKKLKISFAPASEDFSVPQWQQDIVTKRMETARPEDYIPWEKAKKMLKHNK